MDARTVVNLVLEFEDEVNNGGFHQFFNNSSGDNTAETIVALEKIGATAMADILKRAASRFQTVFLPRLGARDWPRSATVFRKPMSSEIWTQNSSPTQMICLSYSLFTSANFSSSNPVKTEIK